MTPVPFSIQKAALKWLSEPLNSLMLFALAAGCQSSSQQIVHNCEIPSSGVTSSSGHLVDSSFSPNGVGPYGPAFCERLADIGVAAVPVPPGTYVNGWSDAMICSARRQDLVISRHEWFDGGEQLGPEGRLHVARLTEVLPYCAESVVIEAEPTELRGSETLDEALARTLALNEQRRVDIVNALAQSGVPDAELRVLLAPIDRVGVRGVESPQVYNQLLRGGFGGRGGQRGGGGFGGGGGGFGGGGGGFGGGGGGFGGGGGGFF